jgi:putative FmdB family regulatory protein
MPTYEYDCPSCGVFSSIKRMSEYQDPQPCPDCGTHASRVLLSAPAFAGMPGGLRQAHATNERSSHAPENLKTKHGAGCGCCAAKSSTSNAGAKSMKSFPGNRPWMISH